MAPANDNAGLEFELDDGRISTSSSPPTHPFFYSPAATATGRGKGRTATAPGRETVCPSPMAVAFSPLGSPVGMFLAGRRKKTPRGTSTATAGAVLSKFIDDCTGGTGARNAEEDGGAQTWTRILEVVDTNVLATLPTIEKNQTTDANGTKKHKSRSRKTNGVKEGHRKSNAEDQAAPQPVSYAAAVKEDPAEVEEREADGADDEGGQENEAESDTETSDESASESEAEAETKSTEKDSKPTPAGGLTFAEAVKEGHTDTESNGHVRERRKSRPRTDGKAKGITPEREKSGVSSQASTAVDYPDIESDVEDPEEEQRKRDIERAPEVAGMRWAPLQVPVKRRLQTLAVLFHCLCIGTTLSIFFSFCAIPLFWPIIIIYLVSILFATDAVDGKLRRRKEWARRLPVWKYFAEYYPAKLHKTHDLVPTRKYILGYHPHGIISHGAWAAFATEALGFSAKFPGITNSLLTLDSNFRLPLYREYVFTMGVLSVSKESITNILTRGGPNNEGMGRAVTIVVGGARESLEAQPNTMRLIIQERKGFIKLAIRTGADLVPVLGFGENDLYDQLDPHKHPWLHNLQRYFLKVWKFTVPLLHGRGIFNYDVGLMPYRRPLNIVVGKPIKVVQAENPDNSEVDRLHSLYTEELQKIWDRYKDEFAADRKEEMQFLN
ncbi:Diacylglycerol O-acyltransferase 2A [Cytospora mali]|uniref:diacylglycerol O-acyltransferase n=1 Tax=Cytospora mali TaxID=578113 RepID=A0A194VAR2_CYTMA|nr:Diacylglycerol O-acyltransferase 2A [Valsa mali var. pyri (nom. inval.)]